MAYATVEDVQKRIGRVLSESEQETAGTLLDDASVYIDATKTSATDDIKKIVSCNMVIRALGSGDSDIPMGATQGSISALGYSQSWTVGNGSYGELYLSKTDKRLLGLANLIGSKSPVEDECVKVKDDEGSDYFSI